MIHLNSDKDFAILGSVGALVLAITWLAATPDTLSGFEESVFRAINDLPDWIEAPGWPVMQLGAIAFVPLVAIVCGLVFKDWHVWVRVMVAGGVAWILAKVVKSIVDRGRPDAFLEDVNLRPVWEGLGFPSGHAAVALAIAVILIPVVSRHWREAIYIVALAAGLMRIYTAAHLPLDVLGGWGLGIVVGAIVAAIGPQPDARHRHEHQIE